jgi:hypothetical protein
MASTPPTVSGSCLHQSIIIPTQKKRANLTFQVSQFTRNQDHAMMPTSRCQHFFDADMPSTKLSLGHTLK